MPSHLLLGAAVLVIVTLLAWLLYTQGRPSGVSVENGARVGVAGEWRSSAAASDAPLDARSRSLVDTVPPASEVVLSGLVVFADGSKAESARVTLRRASGVSRTEVGLDGRFTFRVDAGDSAQLEASYCGCRSEVVTVAGTERPGVLAKPIVLTIGGALFPVTLRITRAAGVFVEATHEAMPGFRVSRNVPERLAAPALGGTGAYLFHCLPGDYDVEIMAGPKMVQLPPQRLVVVGPTVLTVDVPLDVDRPAMATIRVLDAKTGVELPDVTLLDRDGNPLTGNKPSPIVWPLARLHGVAGVVANGYCRTEVAADMATTALGMPGHEVQVTLSKATLGTAVVHRDVTLKDAVIAFQHINDPETQWLVCAFEAGKTEARVEIPEGDYVFRAAEVGQTLAKTVATVVGGCECDIDLPAEDERGEATNGSCQLVVAGLPEWAIQHVQVRGVDGTCNNCGEATDGLLTCRIGADTEMVVLNGESWLLLRGVRENAMLDLRCANVVPAQLSGRATCAAAIPVGGGSVTIVARGELAPWLASNTNLQGCLVLEQPGVGGNAPPIIRFGDQEIRGRVQLLLGDSGPSTTFLHMHRPGEGLVVRSVGVNDLRCAVAARVGNRLLEAPWRNSGDILLR